MHGPTVVLSCHCPQRLPSFPACLAHRPASPLPCHYATGDLERKAPPEPSPVRHTVPEVHTWHTPIAKGPQTSLRDIQSQEAAAAAAASAHPTGHSNCVAAPTVPEYSHGSRSGPAGHNQLSIEPSPGVQPGGLGGSGPHGTGGGLVVPLAQLVRKSAPIVVAPRRSTGPGPETDAREAVRPWGTGCAAGASPPSGQAFKDIQVSLP